MAGLTACSRLIPDGPSSEEILAEPIDGLTANEKHLFIVGDEAFAHSFSAEDGLGPMYIQNSCEACHIGDGKGHPENMVVRFGLLSNGQLDPLLSLGGPQLQNRAINHYPHETIPDQANVISKRIAPLVTGMGFLASVTDAQILANADPNDLDGDGISGRVNYVLPKDGFEPNSSMIDSAGYYIGRFGKKAKEIRLIDQVVFALREDMGMSSDLSMEDLKHHTLNVGDEVAEPEVANSVVDALVFYLRTLKAPTRRNTDDPDVVAGEQLFAQIGCGKCHVPTMVTGESPLDALNKKEFHAYTDLLLHDMGPTLDDQYPEGNAKGNEWRTPPLWGLGLAGDSQGQRTYYLHDGRATSLEEVIMYHTGGEAKGAALAYYQLSKTEQDQLMSFLKSL